MNIEKILETIDKKPEDIVKIYRGRDHHCRCGCGGDYFYRGRDDEFNEILDEIMSDDFIPLEAGTEMYSEDDGPFECDGVDVKKSYINIPYDCTTDECYCLYFEE